jgi:hypothetical protein
MGMGRMGTYTQAQPDSAPGLPVGWGFESFAMNAAIPQEPKRKKNDRRSAAILFEIQEH